MMSEVFVSAGSLSISLKSPVPVVALVCWYGSPSLNAMPTIEMVVGAAPGGVEGVESAAAEAAMEAAAEAAVEAEEEPAAEAAAEAEEEAAAEAAAESVAESAAESVAARVAVAEPGG